MKNGFELENAKMKSGSKHENYEILNLIGYGLAKFDLRFVKEFGFQSKSDFYGHIVLKGIAETVGTVKNRQDLFDPFFDNGRKGWWQKGEAYIHRKIFIDSLFGNLNPHQFADVVKLYIDSKFGKEIESLKAISPIIKSKFKQLQATGQEAELFFLQNFKQIDQFKDGNIEDARLFGDGYDFQVEKHPRFFLIEVKGLRNSTGGIRFTHNEYHKAKDYRDDYALAIVSCLSEVPKLNIFFNPIAQLSFEKKTIQSKQIYYHTQVLKW